MPPPSSLRSDPAHALCAYAEPLVEGRRVVVIGDASLHLGALLVDAGARIVHVYDPDGSRAREHAGAVGGRGVTVRELPREAFDVRDGAFDLAIVPDLSVVEDAPALLARVRRLLAADGALLAAAKNPAARPRSQDGGAAIDYADLYDMVSLQFAHVRMIGLVPFVGVTMAELGEADEDPEVSVDTQFAPEDRTPQLFVALAGQSDVSLAPYALIELPSSVAPVQDDRAHQAALAEAKLRADLLATQLDEARAALQRATSDMEGARARRLADLQEHLHAVEVRAGEHFVRAERLSQEVAALEEEVARQRARAVELEEQSAEDNRARAQVAVELASAEAALQEAEERASQTEVMAAELDAARAELRAAEGRASRTAAELDAARAELRAAEGRASRMAAELDAARAGFVAAEERASRTAAELDEARLAAVAKETPEVDPEAVAALAERAARGEQAEALVRQLEADLADVGELHAEELVSVEALLRERAKTIQELQAELVRRERLVKELVRALEDAQHAHAPQPPRYAEMDSTALDAARSELSALRERLDAMAHDVARREADAQAQAWRVSELEEKLRMASASSAPAPSNDATDDTRALAQAQIELDALRQALAQEHEARARLESGDALTKAQAELARQATLIEQLSRELDARDHTRHAEA